MTALTALWGCSSDGDNNSSNTTFTKVSTAPTWKVDWNWHDASPDWKDSDPTQFECSMHVLVELADELAAVSTADDKMSMFISEECRCVSYRNVTSDGKIFFLLHVKGKSEETSQPMQLRYYSTGAQQLFVNNNIPPFLPNNLMEEAYNITLYPSGSSSKYPLYTVLTVKCPSTIPFNTSTNDKMAVFVGDECRGVLNNNDDENGGWKGNVYSYQAEEKAQIRYYSAEKGGIYVFNNDIKLNNAKQSEIISF